VIYFFNVAYIYIYINIIEMKKLLFWAVYFFNACHFLCNLLYILFLMAKENIEKLLTWSFNLILNDD
jgi:hypothetical protein